MKQIFKYLLFVCFLAAATFSAANFDISPLFGAKSSKRAEKKSFRGIHISKKPAVLLTGLAGQAAIDYCPIQSLTAAAADNLIMVWHLPDVTPLHEIDSGAGFQALSLRFIPGTTLLAAGGINSDNSGSIRFFDAATGEERLQIDEPEPIQFVDPDPGGKFLLATGETYIKVIDIKDGNTISIEQKSNPAARGYYYGNGQFILQSDSLSLFDLKKRSMVEPLDSTMPLLLKKGLDGKTFAWVSAEGVSVVTSAQGGKKFFPLATKGITAFDIESHGVWGLFLLDTQKIAVIELSTGESVKTIKLASPVSDVTLSPDGASAYIQNSSGTIGVYDIGYQNRLKRVQFSLMKLLGSLKSRIGPAAKPEPQ